MKILVTGSGGFLASHLCPRLEQQGHTLVGADLPHCDLQREASLHQYDTTRFDFIYHLAAWTQAGDFCLYHQGEQWLINQLINTNVLAWWKECQPQAKLIAMGSSCCYAPDEDLREENFMKGEPIDSLFTYAMTKRMLYAGLLALQKQFNLRYLCLVPSTLYGSGYHVAGKQMHFIFDLIRKIIEGKLHNKEVVLWGDGHQKRELVYVNDFVSVMTTLATNVDNEVVNIGGGQEYSIREFAGLICEIVGYDPAQIRYDTQRYVGARSKVLKIDKLQRLLPSFTQTPLKEGLKATVAWFSDALARRAQQQP